MTNLYLFNKPYQVLSQFTDAQNRKTLANFIAIKKIYPVGRLDYDSEGLLLLTDNGTLQHQIAHPENKMPKRYWVQVEGQISDQALGRLRSGILLKDGPTLPARATIIAPPQLWPRTPPIRQRKNIPTSWIELEITEGKNRQVRRMTAAVGYPTLRLIRCSIGDWQLNTLQPGEWTVEAVAPELLNPTGKKPVKKKRPQGPRAKIKRQGRKRNDKNK